MPASGPSFKLAAGYVLTRATGHDPVGVRFIADAQDDLGRSSNQYLNGNAGDGALISMMSPYRIAAMA